MEAVIKRVDVRFDLTGPTPKKLYRIRLSLEVAGEKIEATVNELFTEDQGKALLAKLQKGR